jgi:high-affinity K+ transport system ATPase subunit B
MTTDLRDLGERLVPTLQRFGVEIDAEVERPLKELRGRGLTPVLVALDSEVLGILCLTDTARASAAPGWRGWRRPACIAS